MIINICVSANSKYVRYLYVMLISLLENNKDEKLCIYVLNRDFSNYDKELLQNLVSRNQQEISFIHIDESLFQSLPTTKKFTLETYFRFLIPDKLPLTVERVLYLDVDIIVRHTVRELFELDLQGRYVAAGIDMYMKQLDAHRKKLFQRYDDLRYFNAGVMLWDLNIIRVHYKFEDFLKAAEDLHYDLPYADQEVLNYLLYDKVQYFDSKRWNHLVSFQLEEKPDRTDEAWILHFAGYSPWQIGPKTELYYVWWDYAKKSPFFNDLIWEQLWRVEEELSHYVMEKRWQGVFYKAAFELKGTGKIEAIIKASKEKYVIYGAGKRANIFLSIINTKEISNSLIIVDQRKQGEIGGLPIYNNFEWMNNTTQYKVLVTPVNDTELIIDDLRKKLLGNVEILSLDVFLQEAVDIE